MRVLGLFRETGGICEKRTMSQASRINLSEEKKSLRILTIQDREGDGWELSRRSYLSFNEKAQGESTEETDGCSDCREKEECTCGLCRSPESVAIFALDLGVSEEAGREGCDRDSADVCGELAQELGSLCDFCVGGAGSEEAENGLQNLMVSVLSTAMNG
jgi:hypothetical protein